MTDSEDAPSTSLDVSDVDPQELDQLMDDLDAADDNLFKSSLKSLKSPKSTPVSSSKSPIKPSIKNKSNEVSAPSTTGERPKKAVTFDEREQAHRNETTAADDVLNSNNRKTSEASPSSAASVAEKKPAQDNHQFVSSLFADDDTAVSTRSSPSKQSSGTNAMTKGRQDDWLGTTAGLLNDASEKGRATSPSTGGGGGFMADLLGGDSAGKRTASSTPSKEFVLDSKYKSSKDSNKNLGKKTDIFGGGYSPSSKGPAAEERTRWKPENVDDIFGDLGLGVGGSGGSGTSTSGGSSSTNSSGGSGATRQGRRRPTTAPPAKSFQVDDDDIVGDLKSKISIPSKQGGDGDWLGEILKSKPLDATVTAAAVTSAAITPAAVTSPVPSAITVSSAASVPSAASVLPAATPVAVGRLLTIPAVSASAMQIQSLSCAGLAASAELQTLLQEQLQRQQEQAAQQLQEQQLQLEEQFAQQTKQQIQQQRQMMEILSGQQEAAVRRYQSALSNIVGLGLQPPSGNDGDGVKSSAAVEAAALEREVETLRSHHRQQLQMLEKSYGEMAELAETLFTKREQLLQDQAKAEVDQLKGRILMLQKELEEERAQHQTQLLQVREQSLAVQQQVQQQLQQQVEAQAKLRAAEAEAARRLADGGGGEETTLLQQLSSNAVSLGRLSEEMKQQRAQHAQDLEHTMAAHNEQVLRLETQLRSCDAAAAAQQQQLSSEVSRLRLRLEDEQASHRSRADQVPRDVAERAVQTERLRLQQEQRKTELLLTNLRELKRALSERGSDAAAGGGEGRRCAWCGGAGAEERFRMETALEELQSEQLALRKLRQALIEEKEELEEQREELEKEKVKVCCRESALQGQATALQQEKSWLTQQQQQVQAATAAQQQRLRDLQNKTEMSHAAQLAAIQERQRIVEEVRALQSRGLCVRCRRPLQDGDHMRRHPIQGVLPAGPPANIRDYSPKAVLARLTAARKAECDPVEDMLMTTLGPS